MAEGIVVFSLIPYWLGEYELKRTREKRNQSQLSAKYLRTGLFFEENSYVFDHRNQLPRLLHSRNHCHLSCSQRHPRHQSPHSRSSCHGNRCDWHAWDCCPADNYGYPEEGLLRCAAAVWVEWVQRGWVDDDCCGRGCCWEGEKLYVRWSFCCSPLLIWSRDPFHDGMNICYTGNRPFYPLVTKRRETFNSRYTPSFCPVDENLVSQQFFPTTVNFYKKTDSARRGNPITQSTPCTRQTATNSNYPRQRARPHSTNTYMSKYTAYNTWMHAIETRASSSSRTFTKSEDKRPRGDKWRESARDLEMDEMQARHMLKAGVHSRKTPSVLWSDDEWITDTIPAHCSFPLPFAPLNHHMVHHFLDRSS